MVAVFLKLDGKQFHQFSKKLDWLIIHLDVVYKATRNLDGVFIKKSWRKIAKYSRVQDNVRTTDGELWRWGLRETVAGVIILLPEPGNSKEISIYIEDRVNEDLVQDSVESLLLELVKKFNAKLPRKYRSKLRSPQ